ncbi:MAG: reverse transcriptase domain-containing protein, partial [Fusobacteriaceae bacterium]
MARIELSFANHPTTRHNIISRPNLQTEGDKTRYRVLLTEKLSEIPPAESIDERWKQISLAMRVSHSEIKRENDIHVDRSWISAASINIMKERRQIPAGNEYKDERRQLKNKLTRRLRLDREKSLIKKSKEMEKAFATGNSRILFSLARINSHANFVSETIVEKDGTPIYNQARRIDRWAEHFEEQFSWPNPDMVSYTGLGEGAPYQITNAPPTEEEVELEIRLLQRNKAPGPDNIPSELFKEGGAYLIKSLVNLLKKIWESEQVPLDWCKSTIIPIYKKGAKSSCDNHRGISLVTIASKILAGLIRKRLLREREIQTREEQAGFRPGRGCVDHIFSLRQILQHRHTYRQATIVVFLDLKAAFDSVSRMALWDCLKRNGVPIKYVNLMKSLYSNSESRVRVYGKVSESFKTSSGVRQGCPISPFLFNFIMDDIMKIALRSTDDVGVELLPGPKITDIEYADDIALLGNSEEVMQHFLDNLSDAAKIFGMCFAPLKCKILLQDWVGPDPILSIRGKTLDIVNSFTYLGSIISSAPNIVDEINNRIMKARLAFGKLENIWRRKNVRLATKDRLYNACVRSILLYGSETWQLRQEDVQKLSVFDNRCLRYIARVKWSA